MHFPTLRLPALLIAGLALIALFFAVLLFTPQKPTIAVVDTGRMFSQTAPATAANAHLQQVQAILKKGLEDLQRLYKGKENMPQARQALEQGRAALEQQLIAEQRAVQAILHGLLQESVKEWRSKQKNVLLVMPAADALDSDASLDVTDAVVQVYNTKKPIFPALPTVTIAPLKEEPSPKVAPKPTPKPAKKAAPKAAVHKK